MGFFNRKELRAEEVVPPIDNTLLMALLSPDSITKDKALGIPSISACVEIISNIVSIIPIKLYKEVNGDVSEVKDDIRVSLLNNDTGDTLTGTQFKKALITDFLLDKGGYAYIKKERNSIVSLHYVDCESISIAKNCDPIFKEYNILVNGSSYKPYDFFKILRNTKDGAQSSTRLTESAQFLSVMINALAYENILVKTGGNKKGFLMTEYKVTQDIIDSLKAQWKNMYSTNSENCVVLNKGLQFKESSASSVEMQMNENKTTNAKESCKLFIMPPSIIEGNATDQDKSNFITYCIAPILECFQCSANRDLLLEREKNTFYWAFDTKELTKGDIEKRFNAYRTAIDANFMKIDEVRYAENLEPFGLNWIKLGLDSVLYDPKTKQIYTPNTNQTNTIGESENSNDSKGGDGIETEVHTSSDAQDDAKIELEGTVSSISLNGAQIQSLLQIVQAVASNQLEYESAIVLITSAFPFNETVAKQIMGNPKLLEVEGSDNVKGGEKNESGN